MMTVEVKINGRIVASAEIANMSRLGSISDYHVVVKEEASDQTGMDDAMRSFAVNKHSRKQSVWKLVEKVAFRATEPLSDSTRPIR